LARAVVKGFGLCSDPQLR